MAEVAAGLIAGAARALMLAGRWDQADELLGGAEPADDAERAVLAVAGADVAVDRDFWLRTDRGAAALLRASAAVAGGPAGFDLEFLRLKHDYGVALFGPGDGEPRRGPDGRDPAVLSDLSRRAASLRDRAPDPVRRAWAAFYAGLIADVLRGDDDAGRACYEQALEAGDELIDSYALRHLGFLAHAAGDADLARRHWERSKELRQRAGCVPLVLAQQLALAELALSAGAAGAADAAGVADAAGAAGPDAAGARAVVAEAGAGARALGRSWLEDAAAQLLAT
jgi:tetratricopeptide (TPR) repeat protein